MSNQTELQEMLGEEEGTSYNFGELLDTLILHKDVILTVPDDQIDDLRKGLSLAKAKRNAKFKESGLAPMTEVLTYVPYKDKETEGTEDSKVRVKLGPRTNVLIKKLELPDDSL